MKHIIAVILLLGIVLSQEQAPEITLEKKSLLILPSKESEDPESIENKVTTILASEATKLKRFEVIDRSHLEEIINEQALQQSGLIAEDNIVELGMIASAKEALIIDIIHFDQQGVPPQDEEEEDKKDRKTARKTGLLGVLAKEIVDAVVDKEMENVERYPNNIHTSLRAELRKLDVETGKSLDAFSLSAAHTGGNKGKSLNVVLAQIGFQISHHLRNMYLLTSEVLDVSGSEVMLLFGSDLGVRKGTLFDITTQETSRTVNDRNITIPGRSVGIARVTSLSQDANRGVILRQWDRIEPGYRALESTNPVLGNRFRLTYSEMADVFNLQYRFNLSPLGKFGWNILFGVGAIKDSRKTYDLTVGPGLGLYYKLIHTSPFSLSGMVTLPLDFVFRADDEHHTVTIPLFAPRIGVQTLIMLEPKRDLLLSVDYVFSSTTGRWQYTVEDDEGNPDTFKAEWDQRGKPLFHPDGIYFTVGIQFLSF